MYTLVSLTQLINTLPLYEKKEVLKKFEGINTNGILFSLEDIYDSLPDFDKKVFFDNKLPNIGKDASDLSFRTNGYKQLQEWINNCNTNDILDTVNLDDIVEYVKSQGYDVEDDTYKSSMEKLDSIDEDTIVEYLEDQGYTVKLFNVRI